MVKLKLKRLAQAQVFLLTGLALAATIATVGGARNATRNTPNVIATHRLPLSSAERFSLGSLFGFQSEQQTSAGQKPSEAREPLSCGQRVQAYDGRIVGGHLASIGRHPWMISLQREKASWFGFKAFYHSCGGSLISASWILTAAHCVYHRNEPLRAVGGTDNLDLLYRAQMRSIARQIVHPKFDLATYNNDIALLKVDLPFNLRSSFSRMGVVCLEPNLPLLAYDIATICGFGSRAFHKRTRSHLYETDIAIIDQRVCNASFGGMITKNMLCAGGMIANKRDACSGDSGGPLLMEVPDGVDDDEGGFGHISLIGVVSFGNDCALQNYPGIYTRVARFYDWILDNIDEPLAEPHSWG